MNIKQFIPVSRKQYEADLTALMERSVSDTMRGGARAMELCDMLKELERKLKNAQQQARYWKNKV